jgi:DNA-binding CsgD family transcriptional regulator
MKTGLDYFLDDVRKVTKTRPPFNEAFVSRMLNLMNTSITIIEGLNSIISKQKAELDSWKVSGARPVTSVSIEKHSEETKKGLAAYREKVAKHDRNAQIVRQFKDGATKSHIASKHGISQSRVFNILKREGLV